MKKLLFLLLLPAVSQAQSPREFKLKGDLKLTQPIDWVYVNYHNGEAQVSDSFQTKTGAFSYEGKIAEPTTLNVSVKYALQPGAERAKREGLQLFIAPGKMDLTVRDSLQSSSVSLTGSAGHVDFAALQKEIQVYNAKSKPLIDAYMAARKENKTDDIKKIERSLEQVDEEIKKNVFLAFLKSKPNSPIAIYVLKQYMGWDFDPNEIEGLFQSLPASLQQLPSAVRLKESVNVAKKTAVGAYAMDFTQADTLGNPVSLSAFRGKYVLVDFWASWCGPCRVENPNVVKAFHRFKDKNFTILGVSLDREGQKERWMKAIHDDKLAWTQVSDLKYWDNAVAKQYGIRAIPQNILIDPQGKIIARNLNGEKLEETLTEILK
jgi:peroxiredoxin